jgi:hypothetical protein
MSSPIVMAQYLASPPTLVDGQWSPLLCTNRGSLLTATGTLLAADEMSAEELTDRILTECKVLKQLLQRRLR